MSQEFTVYTHVSYNMNADRKRIAAECVAAGLDVEMFDVTYDYHQASATSDGYMIDGMPWQQWLSVRTEGR